MQYIGFDSLVCCRTATVPYGALQHFQGKQNKGQLDLLGYFNKVNRKAAFGQQRRWSLMTVCCIIVEIYM
jgi:hypothetical protein